MLALSPITLNSSLTAVEMDPAITQLSDGRTVVVWRGNDSGIDETGDTKIKVWYRVLNADGTYAGDAAELVPDDFGAQILPQVAELSDGRIAVVWQHYLTAGAPDHNIRGGLFTLDGDGTLALDGDVFDVNTTTASDQRAPDITALSDGKFAIVWKSYDSDGSDGFTGYDITLRVFDGAGGATAEFVAPEGDHYYDHEPKIATLPNGNFVVTWYNSSNNLTNGGSGDIHFAIYQDAPGYPRVTAQTITTTDPVEQYAHHPDIAVDPVTGQFVLVWEQRNITVVGSDKTIMAQRFDAHGVAQGGAFVLQDVAGLDDDRAKVAFLTDGCLVAIWRTDIVADPNNTHGGAIFDTDGTRHDFAFSANDELFTSDPEITATADGGFAIAWNGYHAVTYTTDILIQRFDSDGNPVAQGDWPSADTDQRLTGASGHDLIDGGAGNDTILGQRGNDTLSGFDGDDVILGGRGRDKIDGGAGDDFLRGHQGNDMIQGGEGHDKLFGNRGNDTLRGQEGDDTISGGQGRDHIEGGSGNDSLYGGNGNDRLLGNTGDDFMTGDRGNDILQAGEGFDILHGGSGFDHLIGGLDQDMFVFLQGDDTAIIHDFSILEEDYLVLDDIFLEDDAHLGFTISSSQAEGWVQIETADHMLRIHIKDHADFFDATSADPWQDQMLSYIEGAVLPASYFEFL